MYRVFTRDEAMAAGISPAQLRSPRYRSISRGLYCPTSVLPSQAEVVAALMRKLPVAQFACRETAARAREVAALVRKGVESPYETRARLLIISCGLPEPEPNHPLRDATGRIVRRIDLGYEHYGIAVEYDGRDHIRREEQWHSDIARREELDDDWKFIVLTSRDIHRKQAQTAERVHKALRARGYKGPFDPLGWRRHFAP